MYKGSIAYGLVVRFEKICSIEETPHHFEQLQEWLVKRAYREDHVPPEIEIIKLVKITASFQTRDKKVYDSIRLGLKYHPALNQLYEILQIAHEHTLKDYIALYHHHQR